MSAAPEWVKVGTEVVVYSYSRLVGKRIGYVTKIDRVTATTFTVPTEQGRGVERYRHNQGTDADGAIVKRTGSYTTTYYVLPLDSDAGRKVVAETQSVHRRSAAMRAARAFGDSATTDNLAKLRAAIDALRPGDVKGA